MLKINGMKVMNQRDGNTERKRLMRGVSIYSINSI